MGSGDSASGGGGRAQSARLRCLSPTVVIDFRCELPLDTGSGVCHNLATPTKSKSRYLRGELLSFYA